MVFISFISGEFDNKEAFNKVNIDPFCDKKIWISQSWFNDLIYATVCYNDFPLVKHCILLSAKTNHIF